MQQKILVVWVMATVWSLDAEDRQSEPKSRSYSMYVPPFSSMGQFPGSYPLNYITNVPQQPNPGNFHMFMKDPECAINNTAGYCLEDKEYPAYEILDAYNKYRDIMKLAFPDFPGLNTESSVDSISSADDEKYLCAATVNYIRPLRAMTADGNWKVVVNIEGFTQTIRLEECTSPSSACPQVPGCISSRCVQKYIYHRLMTFNPFNFYNPFCVDIFKITSACSCLLT